MQPAAVRSVRYDIARLTSTLAAPAPVAGMLLVCVACYRSTRPAEGLALGALLSICATLPATLYIDHVLLRCGSRQRHLPRSSERLAPLAIGCVSVLVPAIVLHTLEASRDLQTVLVTMLCVLALSFAVTPLMRISVHMAAIAGSAVVLQLMFGAIGVALLPIVVVVGWSRLELREHTPAQVAAGASIGAVGASAAYILVG